MLINRRLSDQNGFTLVELLVSCVIIPIIIIGISTAYTSVGKVYKKAKQINEMYEVLTACPEIERALQYDVVATSTSCYPNNTFTGENGGTGTYTYLPALTVTATGSLPNSDPLYNIPDSKVIDVNVSFTDDASLNVPLRLLISRNGISQQ